MGIFVLLSFANASAATITSTRAGGNWNDPATWVGGVVPSTGDDVTITSGATVVIDSDAVVGTLTVSGILQYDSSSAYTLTATEFITVNAEGIFRSAQAGAIKNHRLIAHGSIINNGTIDFSSNANETGVELVFTGPGNAIFNCSDAILTNLRQENGITLNKGKSSTSVLSFIPGKVFQVLSASGSSAKGFLTIDNGTFNVIGSRNFRNPVFNADGTYTIPATGGFWLGNLNAEITGMNGDIIIQGELKITNGIFNAGTSAGNSLKTEGNGNLKISGGVVNVAGKLTADGGVCSISEGTLNLAMQPNSANNEPALRVSSKAKLEIFGNPLITITYPNSGQQLANDIQIQEGSGSKFISGGAIQLGTEATPAQSFFLVSGERIIPYLTAFSECSTVAYNTSKVDVATIEVSALPRIALDKTAPEITAPEKITIKCGETPPSAYASLSEFTKAGGVVSDNCAVNPFGFKLVKEVRSKAICPYIITRTYEIADASGNTTTTEQKIYVEGNIAEPQAEPIAEQPIAQELKLKSAMASFTAVKNGDWNDPATWGGTGTPSSTDDVSTATFTVTVNAASFCKDITIDAGGTLNYSGTNTLTVSGNLLNIGTISSVGVTGKILLYGNWTNNGTYNGGTNGIVEFTGTSNATINGSTNFEELTITKGSLNTALTITGNTSVTSGGSLLMNSGLIKIPTGGSFTVNPASALSIPAIAGFDIVGGILSTGNFTISNRGLMRISSGTANFGTNSGNSIETLVDGVFQVSGTSVVNIAGRLENSAGGTLAPLSIPSGINISGGTVTLATKGNGLDNVGTLNVTTNGAFNFTGGTIVFQSESTAGPAIDLGLVSGTGNGAKTTVGGTFQFGNALTPPNTIFNVSSSVPLNNVTSTPNADLKLINDVTIGNWVLDPSTTIDLNGKKIQLAVSTSGTNYTFPIANGSNLAKLVLNFSGITSAGTVTIASSGVLPSGFLLNPGTLTTPIYITNNTVVYSTVSGSYQLPSGFTASQKVGFYNGSWSYQPAAASVSFSGWNNITGSAFVLADCTSPTITGTLNVCAGLTTLLTGSDSPAASSPWISGTPSVAMVDNSGLVTGVSAGTSLITYTNNAGCQQTVTVTVNALPTISGTLNVCVGSTTNLTGSGTPAATTPWASSNTGVATVNSAGVVTGGSAGTSVITYTNTNGCTITATITVNPLPVPTVTGPNLACAGSTGNIYFTEPGMGTYTWTVSAGGIPTAGAGTNSITVTWNTAGPQIVTVSYTNINGCTAASPKIYDVTVNPKPTVVITNPASVCSPSTVDLTASAVTSGSTAGLGYSYFTDVNGTITLTNPSTVSVTGTYYIKGTTAAGCSDIKSVSVTINPKPTVVITDPAAVCSPATVNLSLAAVTAGSTASLTYTYWNDALATNPLSNYTTVGVTGTYYIKGATSSCYDIKPVSVVVNQTPVGTNTSTTICSGGNPNINLAAGITGTNTFTWTVGSNTNVSGATSGSGSTLSQTLTSTGNGGTVIYRVTPTAVSSGCVGAAYSVTVTVNTLPTVTTTETEVVACERSFVSFTAAATGSPNPTVQWQIASDPGGTWTNLANSGTDIVGVTTNSLLIFIPNGAPSPRYYRAVYTNTCGSTPSNAIKLISDKGPQLNTDMPGTINGCAGGTITFTAKVTGAGAGNKPENRIDGIIQYLDGSTWVDIPSSAKSDNSGTLDYSFSIAISNYPYGTTFRIAFTGKCGSVSSSTRVIYPTSVVTAPNGCVGTPLTLSHDGSPGGTWKIINSSGSIVFSLSNAPGQTLSYTPTAVGCYTAQYSTGSCNDAKQFVVFPALPSVPFVTAGCGSPVSLSTVAAYSGFTVEYAVQPPSGVMSSWGTFAQAQALLSNTAGCWTLKARYVLAADCGITLAGSTTTATGCSEAVFNAFVFPSKPILTAPFNTCASAFTLPSVPAISGFNVEYSINTATFTTTPVIPTTPGCHTIRARYVVATACGTVSAGATSVGCDSDPVNVVIFPAAPAAPTVSAGCGAFTVTPPTSIAGFNIEYSFDNGLTWSVSNVSPVGENCAGYTVVTRYVLASDCGTTVAGTTGAVAACSSSPSVIRKVDTTPPVVTCNTLAPAPVCPNTGSAYVHSGTSWDASVSDNCAAPTAYASLSGATTATNLSTLNNVSFNIGITTVTWTASDGCNTSTCSFSVTVNPKPVINPMTATICSGSTFTVIPVNGTNGTVPAGTTYTWLTPTLTGGLTGGAAGAGASITGLLNNTTGSVQTATYTVTPTSGAGCVGAAFTVTVTVNPILTCIISGPVGPLCPSSTGNIYTALAGMSNYSWSISGNGDIIGSTTSSSVSVTARAGCDSPFILTLNYNNATGCSSSCTVSVNVVDNTPPTITCQGGVTTNTNSGQCIAAPVVLVPPTVSDGCTGSITITNDAPAQYPIGVTIVTWTATDACGNWTTCTQTVTVIDNQAGTLSCTASFQWPADDNELFATGVPIPKPPLTGPSYTYTDNCGTYTLTWTLTGATSSNSASTGVNEIAASYPRLNVGDNTFTYTVTDVGGNVSVCSFIVNVYSAPEIACQPGIITDTSTNSCTSTFDPGVPDLIQGQPNITWTWEIDSPISATVSGTTITTLPRQSPPSIGKIIFDHGTTTITWTASNAAGTVSCTQIITVNDVIQPIYTPSPLPIEQCVENIFSATYALGDPDVVKVNPDPDYYLFHAVTDTYTLDLDLVNYLKDNCCPDVGTVTWTITFSPVPDATAPYNPPTPPTMITYPPISGSGQPSAYTVAGVPTDIKLWGDGVTYQPVTHTISYTVYDCHGNHSTFDRQITINPRPELTKMP